MSFPDNIVEQFIKGYYDKVGSDDIQKFYKSGAKIVRPGGKCVEPAKANPFLDYQTEQFSVKTHIKNEKDDNRIVVVRCNLKIGDKLVQVNQTFILVKGDGQKLYITFDLLSELPLE